MQITEDMREEIKVILDEAFCQLMEVLEGEDEIESIILNMNNSGAARVRIHSSDDYLESVDILPHDMEESLIVEEDEECPCCGCSGDECDDDEASNEGSFEDLLRILKMALPHSDGSGFTTIKFT